MKILALPGFLGASADMSVFLDELGSRGLAPFESDILAVTTDPLRGPAGAWFDWSKARLQELQRWKQDEPLLGIGYSLGGRLLLSIASLDPFLFDGLVFISTNPGLADLNDRKLRLDSDREWARRFENDDWDVVLRDWNAQPVFKGGKTEPARKRSDYSRPQVARALREFSLALQPDYSVEIGHWRIPQLWLAGEADVKFQALLKGVQSRVGPHAKFTSFGTIAGASHRVLVDQPEATAARVAEWIAANAIHFSRPL